MLVFLPYLLPKEFIMIDILLVEDDKEICFIFTELLKKKPLQCFSISQWDRSN